MLNRKLLALPILSLLSLALVARADEPRGGRQQRLTGEVRKVDGQTLTIASGGDGGERTASLRLDDKTRINLASDEKVRVIGDRGDVQERRKVIDGKPADLKPGMRVAIVVADGVVTEVTPILAAEGEGRRPEAARQGGDAPRTRGASPPAPGDAPREGARVRQQGYGGEIASVGDGQLVLTIRGDAGERNVELKIDDKTHITLPGEQPDGGRARPVRVDAKPSDLKAGQRVSVVAAEGVAREVAVSAPRGAGAREAAPRDGDPRPAGAVREGEPRRDGDAPARPAAEGGRRAGAAELLQGDIAKVDGDSISVNPIKGRERAGVASSVPVAPDAEIIIEGKPGKLADLKPGMPVTVSLSNGKAVRIEVPIDLSKPRQ